jgi:hypothetical protein
MSKELERLRNRRDECQKEFGLANKEYEVAYKTLANQLCDVAIGFAKAKVSSFGTDKNLITISVPQICISVDAIGCVSGNYFCSDSWRTIESVKESITYGEKIIAELKECIDKFEWKGLVKNGTNS